MTRTKYFTLFTRAYVYRQIANLTTIFYHQFRLVFLFTLTYVYRQIANLTTIFYYQFRLVIKKLKPEKGFF